MRDPFLLVRSMKILTKNAAVWLAIGWTSLLFACSASAGGDRYAPSEVILSFDMTGGQKPRYADGPVLELRSDGQMSLRALKPGGPRVSRVLDAASRADLLSTLVSDFQILQVSQADIESDIAGRQQKPRKVLHAPTTRLYLKVPEGVVDIQWYGVSISKRDYGDIEGLQALYAAQRYLLDYAAAMHAR